MTVLEEVGKAFYAAAGMFWVILWALILGFALSGVVIAFVPKTKMVKLLGKPGPKQLGLALFFGAVSSSCSYAAAAMARSIFQKGAHILPALAFMLASTNLVVELSVILWIMMGWQFVVAEFVGGIILVFVMAGLMRLFAPLEEFVKKQRELEQHAHGPGHVGMESEEAANPRTLEGWRQVARSFKMEWAMIWKDIVLGVVIAGFIMVWVPDSFWHALFLRGGAGSPTFWQILENAAVGPIVSVISFVCSVGNIPLASVLYRGGITFGGTVSFIYADLIIIPLILIYRKYYGWKWAAWITGIFYVSMVITGVAIDLLFSALGWIPHRREVAAVDHMHFFAVNYTLWLNIVFVILAGVLVWLARSGTRASTEERRCCHH